MSSSICREPQIDRPLGCDVAGLFRSDADVTGRCNIGTASRSETRTPSRTATFVASRVWDGVFALGLILTLSSQLRLSGSLVGPGELLLLVWLLAMLSRQLARLTLRFTPALSRMLVFWSLFAIALSTGTITAAVILDRHDPGLFSHDIRAYIFAAAISCVSAGEFDTRQRVNRVAWYFVTFGAASLVLQLVDAHAPVRLTHSDPWYWERFRGWSENPAQLAFLCAALSLMALHLGDTTSRSLGRIIAIASALLSIWVGRLTRTDTFTFVLVCAGPIFIGLKLLTWLRSSVGRITLRASAGWIGVLGLPLMLISAMPLGYSLLEETTSLAKALSKDNGKGAGREAELRLELWSEAWARGLGSGMLGLGPGPHLPIPASLVTGRATEENAPKNIQHPTVNGTPNFEAHNTILDIFVQGGLLAVLSLLWIGGSAIYGTIKERTIALTTLVCGLLLFGMFDMIARYPVFWCTIAFCLTPLGRTQEAATRQRVTI